MSTILAIDDQRDNLTTIQAILKILMPDIELLLATSGLEGIKLAKEKKPSIILLDIIMPLMDGYDTCRVLKSSASTKDIPVVMITANSTDSKSKVKALELGADAFIPKPVEPVELVAQLKVILRIQKAEAKLRDEKNNLENKVRERTKELALSETKYRLLIENLNQSVLVVQNEKIVFVNPFAIEKLRLIESDIPVASFTAQIHNEDRERIEKNFKLDVSPEEVENKPEFRIVEKDGGLSWYNYSVSPIKWQECDARLYILSDITQEKEKKLLEKVNSERTKLLLNLHHKAANLTQAELIQYVLNKAVSSTQSAVGFHHELRANSNEFRLSVWPSKAVQCDKLPQDIILSEFDTKSWLQCIHQKTTIVSDIIAPSSGINNYAIPVPIKQHVNVPVLINGEVELVLGIGNKTGEYTQTDIETLEIIANELSKIIEKRKVENEVVLNKEKYQAIYNNTPLPIQSLNSEGHIIEMNPAWLKLLGYKRDEVIGRWYGDFLHHDYIQDFKENHPKLMKYGRVKNVPFKLRTKKGDYLEIRLDGSATYDAEGRFLQTYSTFKNVTEEQLQQRRIEESERKYRTFIEQFQGIAFLANSNYTFDFFEGNVKGITGYEEKEFIEEKVFFKDLIHPDDTISLSASVRNFITSEKIATAREYRIISKNGQVHWILETVSKVFKDNKPSVYGTIQDVSKLKLAEARLKESQRMAKVGSYDWDIVNRKAIWSEELYNILGLPNTYQPSIIDFEKIVHPDDRSWLMSSENIIATLQQPSYEFQYKIIDQSTGKIKHVQVWGKTDFNEKNEPIRVQGTFQDITSSKKIEIELKNAIKKAKEADRLKSAFLANMSHEIRTPMNAIMGFLSIIKDNNLEHNEQRQYINIVEESGERLLNTINDIIEISKIEAGVDVYNPDTKDFITVGSYFCKFFKLEAESKGINLTFENGLGKDEFFITTDFNKLESIISNLLKNAIKFTEHGEVKFGVEQKGGKLLFFVSDTGIGIPSDRLDAIFDRFVQANLSISRGHEGSGLGLSICKAYCKMLNGEIWVESQEKVGSTFFFTIEPEMSTSQPEKQENKEIKMNAENGTPTILIAEDDDASFQLIEMSLRDQKFNIIRAFNGIEVLELMASNNDIAAILMDLKMPKLNGFEATKEIRKMYSKEIPIIAQTAYAMHGDSEKALAAGCNDYITKPTTKATLINALSKFL